MVNLHEILRHGDVVSITAIVNHAWNGLQKYLSVTTGHTTLLVEPKDVDCVVSRKLVAGDTVGREEDEHAFGTVIAVDSGDAWVKNFDGTRAMYRECLLARLPLKNVAEEVEEAHIATLPPPLLEQVSDE